eukprot:6560839-Prymnesium_polylepis.2
MRKRVGFCYELLTQRAPHAPEADPERGPSATFTLRVLNRVPHRLINRAGHVDGQARLHDLPGLNQNRPPFQQRECNLPARATAGPPARSALGAAALDHNLVLHLQVAPLASVPEHEPGPHSQAGQRPCSPSCRDRRSLWLDALPEQQITVDALVGVEPLAGDHKSSVHRRRPRVIGQHSVPFGVQVLLDLWRWHRLTVLRSLRGLGGRQARVGKSDGLNALRWREREERLLDTREPQRLVDPAPIVGGWAQRILKCVRAWRRPRLDSIGNPRVWLRRQRSGPHR